MRAKRDLRLKVVELRRRGLSYGQIRQSVSVSKSSVSLWCRGVELDSAMRQQLFQRQLAAAQQGLARIAELRRNGTLKPRRPPRGFSRDDPQAVEAIKALYEREQLSVREVAARLVVGWWRVYRVMRRNGITRRRGSDQNYATYKTKPQFQMKACLTPDEERLRVAGVMLYMAEGAKTTHLVDFTNSDPSLVGVFVKFLREICGVAESRLRVSLYAYANQNMEALNEFWSSITRIPTSQFTKPYVRALTPNVRKREMPRGLAHIRYSDKRLLELLKRWGQEISRELSE